MAQAVDGILRPDLLSVVIGGPFPCSAEGLKAVISAADPAIEIVVHKDLRSLALTMAQVEPAALLLDVDGDFDQVVATLEEVRNSSSQLRIGLVSGPLTAEQISRLMQFGPSGLLSKKLDGHELAGSLRLIALGHLVFGSEALHHLHHPSLPPTTKLQLEPREEELLRHLVSGLDNNNIAATMFISRSAVKRQLQVILTKLGATNRVQAAVAAARQGLV